MNDIITNSSYENLARSLYRQYRTYMPDSLINRKVDSTLKQSDINIEFDNVRDFINNLTVNYYANESVIKNSFIKNCISKHKSHTLLYEFNVKNSRVDLCKINGKSIAYEIKTDFDSFNRLDTQLPDYATVFEKVYLIISKHKYDSSRKDLDMILPKNVGIYSYKNVKGIIKFNCIRKALLNKTDPLQQLIHLSTYELKYYFNIPNSYSKDDLITSTLSKYSVKFINTVFKKAIKYRYSSNTDCLYSQIESVNHIDMQYVYKHKFNHKDFLKKMSSI